MNDYTKSADNLSTVNGNEDSSGPNKNMFGMGSIFTLIPSEKLEKAFALNGGKQPPPLKVSEAKSNPPGINIEFCYQIVNILEQERVLVRYNDVLYMREGSIYRPLNEGTLQYYIYSYIHAIGFVPIWRDTNLILRELSMRAPRYIGEPNDERYTFCRNGYFNNLEGRMEWFVPTDYFPTIQLKGAYLGPGPQFHPMMDEFFETLFNGDPILMARAWEILGYLIASDAHAKRFFAFPGASGDNGKSSYIGLTLGMFNGPATSSMSMKNLLGGRFALSELKGKRINFSSDEGSLNLSMDQLAVLKRISGHDMITADKKNSMQVSFLSTCKIVIASNHDIGMAYSSCDSAVMRRLCTLPFNVRIPRECQNPNIVNMILANELDQITTEALNAFIRLKNNGFKFTGDGTGLDDYTISFNPVNPQYAAVKDFVNTCIEQDSECFTLTQSLFEAFTQKYGLGIFRDITAFSQCFSKVCEAVGYMVEPKRQHTHDRNARGYAGIKLV